MVPIPGTTIPKNFIANGIRKEEIDERIIRVMATDARPKMIIMISMAMLSDVKNMLGNEKSTRM